MSKDQRPTEHQEWRDSLPYKNDDPTCVPKHSAECHCGAVRYAASSDPVSAIMCHCTTCQVVHGAPMQWAVIMKKDTLRFEPESLDQLEFYNTHDKARLQRIRGGKELIVSQIPGRTQPCKVSCRRCGSLIADEGRNMWLAFPELFKFDGEPAPRSFEPTDHIFYAQRVVDVQRKEGVKYWVGAKGESEEHDFGEGEPSAKKRKVE